MVCIYICLKGVYPLKQLLQNLASGRVSQEPTITPTFTIVALKIIIIVIITDLYSAFRSEDTEALDEVLED